VTETLAVAPESGSEAKHVGPSLGSTDRRLRVLYVVYWGLHEPLGRSLVLPAVRGLAARGVDLELVTFEKPHDLTRTEEAWALRASLAEAGVRWTPLRYHKRPTAPATAYDVAQGVARGLAARARGRFDLIHARTFVGGLVGRALRGLLRAPMIYHGEGFWPDQQVEGGFWRADSRIYRTCHAIDRRLIAAADGLVLLSRRSRAAVEAIPRKPRPGQRVEPAFVPSCVDLSHFHATPPAPAGGPTRLVYIGSLGNRYPIEPLGRFLTAVRALDPSASLTVLSQSDHGVVREGLMASGAPSEAWTIGRAPHSEIPARLSECRAGLFFLKQGPGAESCSPTKVGEYWAAGLPVVTTPGAGDTDEAVRRHRVGVIVDDLSAQGCARAAVELRDLLSDPELPERCRRAADLEYSLDRGLDAQLELYRSVLEARGRRGLRPRPGGAD
jgi:glycosyltransferase involved in cell wall biosynthesis